MLKNNRYDELKDMYRLFSKVDSTLGFILEEMSPYIEERGKSIIDDDELKKDPVKFTIALLTLKEEMDTMISECFTDDPKFQLKRDKSFQNFMNLWSNTPYSMAEYVDYQFKKGIKGYSEDQIDSDLSAILRLYQCLYQRDCFIKAYSELQAMRLLEKSSLNTEQEQNMLSKLRMECGHNTVSKISKMFTDIDLSKEVQAEFKTKTNGGVFEGANIVVSILTQGQWPNLEHNTLPVKLPAILSGSAQFYEDFYKQKHSGRHLEWLHGPSTVAISPTYTAKPYGFNCSVYQAAVLCLFNQNESLTFLQISDQTNIPKKELMSQLKMLCNPGKSRKAMVLKKGNMKSPKFIEDEEIKIFAEYKNPGLKVNFVPKRSHQKSEVPIEDEDPKLKIDRMNNLQAIVVRIMKARKTWQHNPLIQEVIKQVILFRPQPLTIKEAIEILIEKEFLKRDEDNHGTYIYIP